VTSNAWQSNDPQIQPTNREGFPIVVGEHEIIQAADEFICRAREKMHPRDIEIVQACLSHVAKLCREPEPQQATQEPAQPPDTQPPEGYRLVTQDDRERHRLVPRGAMVAFPPCYSRWVKSKNISQEWDPDSPYAVPLGTFPEGDPKVDDVAPGTIKINSGTIYDPCHPSELRKAIDDMLRTIARLRDRVRDLEDSGAEGDPVPDAVRQAAQFLHHDLGWVGAEARADIADIRKAIDELKARVFEIENDMRSVKECSL
jgi:hypothetical protein